MRRFIVHAIAYLRNKLELRFSSLKSLQMAVITQQIKKRADSEYFVTLSVRYSVTADGR